MKRVIITKREIKQKTHPNTDVPLADRYTGGPWAAIGPFQLTPPSLYTEHDILWYGMSLWLIQVSCPGCGPSWLILLENQLSWQKLSDLLDVLTENGLAEKTYSQKFVQKRELQKACSELLLVIGRSSGKNTLIFSPFSVNLLLIDLH